MKTIQFVIIVLVFAFVSCRKDKDEGYTSVDDFLSKNASKVQSYNFDAATGISFATNQGTEVTVPPNALKTYSGQLASGNVTVYFKDVYKKSEMLLADRPTTTYDKVVLKSGGEFLIRFSYNEPVYLGNGKKISLSMPAAKTGGIDTDMKPFIWAVDSNNLNNEGWMLSPVDSLYQVNSSYLIQLAYINSGSIGNWSNCDDPFFYSSFPVSTFKMIPSENINDYGTIAFLVFKNESTIVSMNKINKQFEFSNTPVGFQCTAVALGIRDGNLYSSFTPMVTGTNQSINFNLKITTTGDFITQLKALN